MLNGSGYCRLTGHRERSDERLKAGGEGRREPHAERQALLDLLAFAERAGERCFQWLRAVRSVA